MRIGKWFLFIILVNRKELNRTNVTLKTPCSTLLPVTAALIFLKTIRSDISLSPKTWPLDEFDRMERMTLNRFERPKPLAVSNGKGLMAATIEPFAVHSGMDALRKGGTAMYACLATTLAGIQKVGIFS